MKSQSGFDTGSGQIGSNGNPESVRAQTQAHNSAAYLSADGSSSPQRTQHTGQEYGERIILRMQKDLFEHGRRRSVESGVFDPNADDLRAIESHASAMARETYRTAYDPAQQTHDQLLESEYQKNLADRAEAEQAEKYAAALVREREEEVAQAHPGPAPSKPSVMLLVAAVVAIMVTVAPTLHDFVFVMSDDFLSWLLSLLSGLFLGLLVTLMIFGDLDATGQRTLINRIGLAAGILISLALGGLRIKEANDAGDYIFAAALTILELGIVLGLEGVASSHRTARRDWAARKAVADPANALLEMARAHLERCKERVKDSNDAITSHISYVEDRAVRHFHINEIEATALRAVRDGYHAGIAENRGRILGLGGKQL